MSTPPPGTRFLIESMTKLDLGHGIRVRIWREEEFYSEIGNADLRSIGSDLRIKFAANPSKVPGVSAIARQFIGLERVNAVEVVRAQGDGVVIYKDWP